MASRINVVEREESLSFTNTGSFVPGDVERVVMEDAPEEHYRNRFLATAMFNLKMVDTAGGGIRKLFMFQRQRFFPMPDYDLSGNRVQLTLIEGRKPNYFIAKSLAQQTGQKARYSKNLVTGHPLLFSQAMTGQGRQGSAMPRRA